MSARPAEYGMLWSAVSCVCGLHLSGPSAMILMAERDAWMLTSRISSGLLKYDLASTAACATVWENWPSGKRLVKQRRMPNGSPSCGGATGLGLMNLKNPERPSKTLLGPVIPVPASCHEKIPLRHPPARA